MERMNGKKEVRTGNFFLTHENGKVTFRDLSGNVTFAVSDKYPVGMMFSMAMEDKANEDFIHNYVAVLSNALCVVPDREYLKDVDTSVRTCLDRHKELYGFKDVPDEEDARILDEERQAYEDRQAARKDLGLEP